MKIVLVNLPWKHNNRWGVRAGSRWPHIKDHTENNYLPFPFYLAYAAALLEKNGFEVEIIDAIADKLSENDFFQKIVSLKPQLLVAETSTVTLAHDLRMLIRHKDHFPIALCGPEVQLEDPKFLEKTNFIDYLMFGEYEQTLLELCTNLKDRSLLSDVAGLIYKQDGIVIKNSARSLIQDLDSLPWPQRKKLPIKRYNDSPGDIPVPCASMWASRGCPFQCSFCLWPQVMYKGGSYRVRNVVDVVDEMEYLVKQLGFKSIYFDDDTWNIGKERIFAFCDELEKRNLQIPWAIMARAELMDEPLLERMRKAGLFSVKYGVESSSQKLLDNISKGSDLKKVEEVVNYTKYLGIRTHLTFTFGLPGEDAQTVKDTIEYAKKLNPTSVQFSLATPFPGTRFYDEMDKKGYILDKNWENFDGNHSCVIRTKALSAKQLLQAKKTAYKQWEKHIQMKLKKLQPLKPQSLKQKLSESLKNKGLIATFLKVIGFLIRRLMFLPLRLRQYFSRKLWIIEETISNANTKIIFSEGRVRLYWKNKEVSKDVGINTSMHCGDRWIDSSLANWKLEKTAGNSIKVKLKWDQEPVRQQWLISIEADDTIKWSSEMQIDQDLEIMEYKAGLLLESKYTMWKDDLGTGIFPKITEWEEIELYNSNSSLLWAISQNKNPSSFPDIELRTLTAYTDNTYPQIQNTDKKINGRIFQMRRLKIDRFQPGVYDYFNLEINLRQNQQSQTNAVQEYKTKVPLKFIKEQVSNKGLLAVIKKIISYLNPRKLREYYSDIIGVIDGSMAYKGPFCAQVDLTNDCNNDCIGCWCNSPLLKDKQISEQVKQQTLPLEVVKKTINQLKSLGTKEIYFAGGGEPFMHPHIMEILNHVKALGLRCYINTNFTLVTEDMVKQLVDIGVDNLVVSIWAGTAKTYHQTHPNKSEAMFYQLKGVLKLLNSLKHKKPQVNVYNVISNLNYKEPEQMVDFALESGCDSLEFTVIDTIPDATDALMLSDQQRKVVIEACNKIKQRLETGDLKNKIEVLQFEQFIRRVDNSDAKIAQYDNDILNQMPCYMGWLFARILADGNVNFCLKAHRIPVGNIYAHDFLHIWNNRKQQEFRKRAMSVPKKDVFFSFIGNDPDVKVGCFKGCDDLARNIHMHKKIQSLTRLEYKLLRVILYWIKLKNYFKGKNFSQAIKNKIVQRKILDKKIIRQGKLKAVYQSEGIKLYWAEQEITQSIGLNTSVCIFGLWYDSSKAKWEVSKHNDHELELKSTWNNIPISQVWKIKLNSDCLLQWDIALIVDSKIEIEQTKSSIMISPLYKKWQINKESGKFPSSMNWQQAEINSTDAKQIKVMSVKTGNTDLPELFFDFSENSDLELRPQIQNADKLINSRIISAQNIEADSGRIFLPGDVNNFCLKLNIKGSK
ncbi:MAG: radical SAM protein [Candidatus Omnitrophica bacterium]|nr:radical SAM protein [Candidatus Omnitrophota bacterium]